MCIYCQIYRVWSHEYKVTIHEICFALKGRAKYDFSGENRLLSYLLFSIPAVMFCFVLPINYRRTNIPVRNEIHCNEASLLTEYEDCALKNAQRGERDEGRENP